LFQAFLQPCHLLQGRVLPHLLLRFLLLLATASQQQYSKARAKQRAQSTDTVAIHNPPTKSPANHVSRERMPLPTLPPEKTALSASRAQHANVAIAARTVRGVVLDVWHYVPPLIRPAGMKDV